MLEHFRLPGMVTVVAIALSGILFKEFLKKRAGQTVVEGSADNDSATESGTVESAAPTCTSPQVNEAATSSGYDYEVFLSFRGPDTRSGFTDFLYTSLTDAGIRTFKDDEDLRKGEEFAPELLQAIKQSKISIPIFSKNYASSAWCLKEVVQMVECKETGRQKIMPIFYDVAPSEVRHQTGGYGEAFSSHKNKKRYDQETIKAWEDALNAVPTIGGWDLYSMSDSKREGQSVKTIVQKIFGELKKAYLLVSKYLVNVDNHVDAIMKLIGAQTSETRIIGIHGMGGIGKTTIAKIIYNQLSSDFENCCFLPDIREMSERNGIRYVQRQLISGILKDDRTDITSIDDGKKIIKDRLSNKRVLLLLDDMHENREMDALVGERNWFGKGSKIIITTRNKEILDPFKVDDCYELTGMDRNQSLQLFSKHAFRRDSPLDEYIDQSDKVIDIAKGLPLALEVIGSLLSRTKKKEWNGILKKLKKVPDSKVRCNLKISYDALEFRHQVIFLDIACLFIGYKKDDMVHFWEESEYFPEVAMDDLQNRSLIKIEEDNRVWMHDQLKDLGRDIVREESNMKIEMQSRVWDPEEASVLLRKHEGKKGVEALRLKLDNQKQYCFSYESFESLPNLRFLEVDGPMENFRAEKRLLWHESPSNDFPTNENSDLLPQLRWLSWRHIPPTFNITNFSMEDVVILNLSYSTITDDWKGWNHMKVMKNLKVLDLTYCVGLQRTPIFSSHPNLERLILHACRSLIEIDESICQLKCLVSLDVSDCGNLLRLPHKLSEGLTKLEYLSLSGCTPLEMLPESIGSLKLLIELDISYTLIKELPNSIGNLKKLKVLKMKNIDLSKIPDVLWSIGNLENVEASSQYWDRDIHVRIGNGISGSQSLRILKLERAKIDALPRLPESLITLVLKGVDMNTFPDLSNLTNLKELKLRFGPKEMFDGLVGVSMPPWIGNFSSLESLELDSPCVTTLPADFTLPPRLNSLYFDCPNLSSLPSLPSSLSYLGLKGCEPLCSMKDLSNLQKLSKLSIWSTSTAIPEIPGLGCLENLRELWLQGLKQVKILPDLSNSNKLTHLLVRSCDNLVEIQGQLPQSLGGLWISGCKSLQKLPSLSRSMGLRVVDIQYCDKLAEIQGKLPESLQYLVIDSCQSLQELPDLSSLKRWQKVEIKRCGKLNSEAISSLCSEKSVIFVGETTDESESNEYDSRGQ